MREIVFGNCRRLPRTGGRYLPMLLVILGLVSPFAAAQTANRFATSDSNSGYVHWIELYDAQNNKITADSLRPYSPMNTCGRCHDTETISHGFHFQAGDALLDAGRNGQPWVWSDLKTGTHLPLSYRSWQGTFNPDEVGISRWQMAAQFGGYLPGSGPGSEANLSAGPTNDSENPLTSLTKSRAAVTGALPIDCMMCHHLQGSGYSPFAWTEQIKHENFAYAPFAAMGLGTIEGQVRRLKDDFDSRTPGAAEQLPKVQYDVNRFRNDGKVLFNLVRKPQNNACYYCHTQTSDTAVQGQRWLHDEDIHLRAGMACVDCHRNGLDHATVRGFPGEVHTAGAAAATLTCRGCHLGSEAAHAETSQSSLFNLPGKLGAPYPLHRGIPPLHFERLSCTACHSGPLPGGEELQVLAAVHRLGEHFKRTGSELPLIHAAVQLKRAATANGSEQYAPHRWMWPSYWGVQQSDSEIKPLHPDLAAQWLRRPLKVRQDFVQELGEIKLTLNQRREVLGEERAKLAETEWTAEEQQKLTELEARLRTAQIEERLTQALVAIQAELQQGQAVFVSGPLMYRLDAESKLLREQRSESGREATAYFWPIGHNVRPATQALGAKSCTECHRDDSPFFTTQLSGQGVVPGQTAVAVQLPKPLAGDIQRFAAWNQLMQGRGAFKVFALLATGAITVLLLGAIVQWNVQRPPTVCDSGIWSRWRRWFLALAYVAYLIAIGILGATSFGSLLQGHEMQAWPLLIHVSVAGAFLGLLAIIAYGYLPRAQDAMLTRVTSVLMVTACLATVIAIMPGMFPWLGTPDMLRAIEWHRYAGGAALVTTVLHAIALLMNARTQR